MQTDLGDVHNRWMLGIGWNVMVIVQRIDNRRRVWLFPGIFFMLKDMLVLLLWM